MPIWVLKFSYYAKSTTYIKDSKRHQQKQALLNKTDKYLDMSNMLN